ncbi:hypothetical protein LY28_01530 [Ruminiclostridium sufflavum DSM 19573]|uniref:Uncharacterized protein n=1 Tax=Ruminiclostridium sufflavum DSM 19573 TaxID=1121337 RepID=A0A318Y7Q5_9FIRM|nr:hypothetical protein [Ruminiclostridium sufflavum]PYG88194.1 hypothetical protein LY28_01530 [Ruminiclostridium sufflavum DSM 19573]
MNKPMKKMKKNPFIMAAVVLCSVSFVQFAPVAMAETGSDTTLYDSTYIDKMEIEIKSLIQTSNDDLKKQISSLSTQSELQKKLTDTQNELSALKESIVFKIIKLPAGKTLIGDASTEIIVRNKDRVTAYVSSTATGGVSNLISGTDIPNGAVIPDNQLLLIPKADGRGITAKADADIMIKGTYTIK